MLAIYNNMINFAAGMQNMRINVNYHISIATILLCGVGGRLACRITIIIKK
jgi:hypothetical protein